MRRDCIVVACADERDLPAAISWIGAQRQADVVAVAVDLGQGWDRAAVERRASAAGAARTHVLDASAEFAREYALPALRRSPDGAGVAPLSRLGRSLVARTLVEVAAIEQAVAIAVEPGLEGEVQALEPAVARLILPPVAGAGTPQTAPGPAPLTATPTATPTTARSAGDGGRTPVMDIGFEGGMPASVNGVAMRLLELVDSLSVITGGDGTRVLSAACHALGSDRADGTVHMQFINGECTSLATQSS